MDRGLSVRRQTDQAGNDNLVDGDSSCWPPVCINTRFSEARHRRNATELSGALDCELVAIRHDARRHIRLRCAVNFCDLANALTLVRVDSETAMDESRRDQGKAVIAHSPLKGSPAPLLRGRIGRWRIMEGWHRACTVPLTEQGKTIGAGCCCKRKSADGFDGRRRAAGRAGAVLVGALLDYQTARRSLVAC